MTARPTVRYVLALQGFVLLAYAWYGTAGYWTHLPTAFSWNLYDRLATAFAKGQLYLDEMPAPDLLALPDPYSIQARKNVSGYIGDATLFDGRYYLYWGPVPAIPLAALKAAGYASGVQDATLVILSVSGVFLLLSSLMVILWMHHFRELPRWTVLVAVPVVGLAPPFAWMLNNPLIYEAALASAELFFVGGLLAGYLALRSPTAPVRWFFLCGISWALAIGCQFTQVIAVSAGAALSVIWITRAPPLPDGRRKARASLAVGVPPALMLAALGWYNYARFGSALEFGYRFQLAVVNLHEHYREMFQPVFALPNAYNYLFNPFLTSRAFPFIFPKYGSVFGSLPLRVPSLYYSEAITGLLFCAPVLVLAVVPVARWIRRWRAGSLRTVTAQSLQSPLDWLLFVASAALVPNLAVLLFFYYSAPRYLMAVVPLLLILSVIGFWQANAALRDRPRVRMAVVAAAGLLAVCTVAVSMLLAISSSQDRIAQLNPALIQSINHVLGAY